MLLLLLILLSSCQDGRWYPSAEITIESHNEFTDSMGIKQTFVTFTIRNTSKTSIITSVVTIKLKTDKHEYLQTVTSNIKIIPNGMIALTASIAYYDNTENFVDLAVIDSFFD